MGFQKFSHILFIIAIGLQLQACKKSDSSTFAPPAAPPETRQCGLDTLSTNYFEEITAEADVQNPTDPDVTRERNVKVNIAALKRDVLAGSSQLRLDLFNNQVVEMVVEKIQKTSDEEMIVTGRIKDEPLSSVALAIQDDVVIATVNPFEKSHYRIIYRGSGVHSIQEAIDTEGNNENSCLAEHPLEEAHDEEPVMESEETEAMAAVPVIDMLVTYTPAARIAAGGTSAIKALIQTGIANTNKAFLNSGVNLSVRLVGTLALRQNESTNFSADLSALRTKTDGKWDEVHAERTRLGADQVTVVGNYPNNSVAGIGYIKSTSSTAFTIVKRSAFSMYTFSHELGHNIGLQHSDGYVNTLARFRTIMAYGSYPRIVRFSNPSLKYQTYATGTATNNSAAILNLNGKITASLVATKISSSPIEVPIVTSPEPNCEN